MNWPLTFYVQSLPPNVGGCANGPVVRILEKYRGDKGIHQHEMVHVRQWFTGVLLGTIAAALLYQSHSPYWLIALIAGTWVHPFLYSTSPRYKLWAEVRAYREQARHYADNRTPLFAGFIASNYGLNVTQAEALAQLKK